MTLSHPYMYVFLSAALVLLSMGPLATIRRGVLGVLSGIFLLLVFECQWPPIALLVAFLGFHFGVLQFMLRTRSESGRRAWFYLWLSVSLIAFIIVKKYWWITDPVIGRPWLLTIDVSTIGLSFVFFRQVSLSIDARDEQIRRVALGDYLINMIAFWTFMAGPLQRFDASVTESQRLRTAEVPGREVVDALLRVMIGFTKMFLLAPAAGNYATVAALPVTPSALDIVVFLLACPVYVYVNFSGYCDIMIGLARAVGVTLPENFNHPYKARNLNEFWQRWHITLSTMLRDCLYFPLQTSLSRRLPLMPAMVLATLTSFLIMGAWHGNAFRFAVFGLLHGLGVVAVNLYTEGLRRSLGKAGLARYRGHAWSRAAGIVVCQSYVVFTFLAFNYDWPDLVEAGRRVSAWQGWW